jgi:hypothetical protein
MVGRRSRVIGHGCELWSLDVCSRAQELQEGRILLSLTRRVWGRAQTIKTPYFTSVAHARASRVLGDANMCVLTLMTPPPSPLEIVSQPQHCPQMWMSALYPWRTRRRCFPDVIGTKPASEAQDDALVNVSCLPIPCAPEAAAVLGFPQSRPCPWLVSAKNNIRS